MLFRSETGEALSSRASPLKKRPTGAFFNSPISERFQRRKGFALYGGRPKGVALWNPTSFLDPKKEAKKELSVFITDFELFGLFFDIFSVSGA